MEKYVIDTNVIIASIPDNSPHHWIWKGIVENKFEVYVTTEIFEEYEEVIQRFFGFDFTQYLMSVLENLRNVIFVKTYYAWNLITADPDDNKFVDCAISCNAKCIVSEDKHFNILKTIGFPKVEVLKIEEFAKLMGK